MKKKTALVIAIFCFSSSFGVVHGNKNKSAGYNLYKNLIFDQGYNPNVRPVVDTRQKTTVNVSLNVISIIDLNEISETLTLTAKLKLYWYDEYLTWDPVMYNGLQSMNIPQSNVWKPDIALENSVERYRDMGGKHMYVAVTHQGCMQWKPIEVFRSTCSIDVTKYPVDIHRCCLYFEVWSHTDGSVEITNASDHVILHDEYDGHPQWKIIESTAEEKSIGGDSYVVFCLTLKRQSNYVMLNVILPIALLSLLNNCVFLLPASCGEKASFSVTVFLSLSVFLTIVSEQLPKASNKVSMFNLYVFIQVVLSTMITVTLLVQIRLYHRDDEREVPTWLRSLVISCGQFAKKRSTLKQSELDATLSETNIIPSKATESQQQASENEDKNENASSEDSNHVTWRCVADWMDLVMFVGYTILNIVCSAALVLCSVSV
ncbi:neuronal acetylcholine receptor subunit alpha-7-like [Mercenaria mercenaria]|uniref:neuronal acetylcholine receptor subunit alpha-7-like n=1 Tax=Mercenaria mercenaria TaxID=6596 RepID=UPI00234F49ED|nr:neuronal acetylcholine receptor subunit alpha-7-like [Mercenaria mercenaria]